MNDRPGRGSDQFPLRLPDGMRDQLKEAAALNNRSMNAEIVARLEDFAKIQPLSEALNGVIQDRNRLSAEKEKLEWELDKYEEMRSRLYNDDGSQKPVITVPQEILARIQEAAKQNHRTLDAEAIAALEEKFPAPAAFDLGKFLTNLSQAANRVAGDIEEVGRLVREGNEELERNASEWRVVRSYDHYDGKALVTIVHHTDLPIFEKASTRDKANDD